MRDRILGYLKDVGAPQTSDQILSVVLKIRSPNSVSADRVLQAILGDDPRFRFEGGVWLPQAGEEDAAAHPIAGVALFIQRPGAGAHPPSVRVALYRKEARESQEFDLSGSLHVLDVTSLQLWRSHAEGLGLLVWSADTLRHWNRLLQSCRMERQGGDVICLKNLAARALSGGGSISPEALAAHLGLPVPDHERPAKMAQFLSSSFDTLIEMVPAQHRLSPARLARWIQECRPEVDFSRMSFGREFLRRLPESPGVYVMRNRAADIIYVGKAGNLKRRVSSYFTPRALKDPKSVRLLEQIHSLETINTGSELDALLLETRLIRDFRPPINLQLEVHERPAGYGKGRNLVLLAPQPDGLKYQAYFLRDGVFVGQQAMQPGRSAPSRVCARLKSIYFSQRRRRGAIRESWEMEIVSRWLARNRSRINFINIDEAADAGAAIRILNSYLRDPDRLSRKVIYR